jgi:hypothetical protein
MEHISFTQLNMLLRCGEQYRRRYILKQVIPPSGSLMRGRCCHKAEEKNFQNKITQGEFLCADEVKQAFAQEWSENEGQIGWQEDELEGNSPKKASGMAKDSGIRLIEVFHREQLVNCNPVAIEQEFKVEFEGGYAPMIGRLDRIDEGGVIAEMKFVKKSPVSGDILTDPQLTCYSIGYKMLYSQEPKKLIKQFSVDLREPKTVIQECGPRSQEQISRFLKRQMGRLCVALRCAAIGKAAA